MQLPNKQQEPSKCQLCGQLKGDSERSSGVMELKLEDPVRVLAFLLASRVLVQVPR